MEDTLARPSSEFKQTLTLAAIRRPPDRVGFRSTRAVNRQKNFPVQHWPDGEIEGNVNLTVALKVPFNLGTKQPAIVRLGIGRRTESAGIGTFLNRSG